MRDHSQYKSTFLITSYGVIAEHFILPTYEMEVLKPGQVNYYIGSKVFTALLFVFLAYCIHFKKLTKYWVHLFHLSCYSFCLVGEYFAPGYHYAVIQYMFICAIVFEGFPWAATALSIIFIIEYSLLPFSQDVFPAYPFYHKDVYNVLISSWIISWAMERYFYRFKNKQSVLDRKLRYKGIKTDLFIHDLKNKIQPLMYENQNNEDVQEIVKTLRDFNSFNDSNYTSFEEVVANTKVKFKITADVSVSGDEEFFIDQMDLQTILGNLMVNSVKAAALKNLNLQISINNNPRGFTYEDNAGGFTDEQFKFFSQKDVKPYPGHEKNGLGIFLIKKLIHHQEGKFIIKKIPGGTRFDITY